MRTTTVGDVMTREVVTVRADAPFKEVIKLIVSGGVSAVPVVDADGALLGVVSEADLLHKGEHLDDEEGDGPSLFASSRTRAHWLKVTGLTAGEVMTSPVVTVGVEEPLPAVARRLALAGVRRLFVVDGARLVGVVARRDLLRGFLRGDHEIRIDVEREVFGRLLGAGPTMARATVEHGVVMLTGRLQYEGDLDIAVHLVRAIPGVVAVTNRLDYMWNGDGTRPSDGRSASPGVRF